MTPATPQKPKRPDHFVQNLANAIKGGECEAHSMLCEPLFLSALSVRIAESPSYLPNDYHSMVRSEIGGKISAYLDNNVYAW
jgi:hypothetical protein